MLIINGELMQYHFCITFRIIDIIGQHTSRILQKNYRPNGKDPWVNILKSGMTGRRPNNRQDEE